MKPRPRLKGREYILSPPIEDVESPIVLSPLQAAGYFQNNFRGTSRLNISAKHHSEHYGIPSNPSLYKENTMAVTTQKYQIKIGLQEAKPPIWRRAWVPSSMNLSELHEVIQVNHGLGKLPSTPIFY